MRTRLTAVAFGLAVAAAIFLLAWPVYEGVGSEGVRYATLLQVNGWWAVVPVSFPVVIAAVTLVVRRQWVRIVAAIVLGAFAFISGMSIGLFYFPAAVLMLLAACVEDSARLRDLW